MATMNASTMTVLEAPQVAVVSSNKLASRSSVPFNNGGLPSMTFVRARSVRPLSLRAGNTDDLPDMSRDSPSSTGGISQKAREIAEKTAVTFDGVKEDVEEKLTEGGNALRSKTGDVVYGVQRNAAGVGNDATEKANEAQTKYTKGKE
jgi:hypothetical protein